MRCPQERWFAGKTIDRVEWRPHNDGRGGKLYRPHIFFSDGSYLVFDADEGEWMVGVTIQYFPASR